MPAAFASSAVVIGSKPITYGNQSIFSINFCRSQKNKNCLLTFMPKAFMRIPTSRPILPKPRIANVLPYNSEPEYNLRSHLPSFMLFPAGTIGRAKLPIKKHVSSHALIEFPPGVLNFNDNCQKLI